MLVQAYALGAFGLRYHSGIMEYTYGWNNELCKSITKELF